VKKKIATPAVTPAAVAVPAPKVAAKRAPKKAVKPVVPPTMTPEDAAALAKENPEVAAAIAGATGEAAAKPAKAGRTKVPFRKSYPVAKTSTASLCGSVAAMQQAISVLSQSQGIGAAIDSLNRLEAQARQQLAEAITGELKTRRVKTTGLNVGTESKPDGVHIVLTK
jgi:hypothetical protein